MGGLGRDGTSHGTLSPVRAYPIWAGLCPEKLVKLKLKLKTTSGNTIALYADDCKRIIDSVKDLELSGEPRKMVYAE